MDRDDLKKNLTAGSQWMRLLYMVLFAFLLEIAGIVMLAVVVLQFLFAIFTGGANDNLRRLGDQIASYIYQTLQFLVYNTEEKPFPFSEWPESEVEDLSGYEGAQEVSGEVVSEAEAVKSEEATELGSAEAKEQPEKKAEAGDRASSAAESPKSGEAADTDGDSKGDKA